MHQLIVDAYAVQHPMVDTPDGNRQVVLCLMTLGLFVAEGADPASGPGLHRRMAAALSHPNIIEPPSTIVGMTVDDVLSATDAAAHERMARQWAEKLWQAWSIHHETVRRLTELTLG